LSDEDDSEFFVTVGDGGAIRVWGLKSGLCIYTADKDGLAAQYTEMTFVPASNTVITVNSSQDIVFHETPTLRPVRHIVGYNDDVIDLKMLDQDHMVVATNSEQVRALHSGLCAGSWM
jgi:U3 small nucleolar RNA-associated protein 13